MSSTTLRFVLWMFVLCLILNIEFANSSSSDDSGSSVSGSNSGSDSGSDSGSNSVSSPSGSDSGSDSSDDSDSSDSSPSNSQSSPSDSDSDSSDDSDSDGNGGDGNGGDDPCDPSNGDYKSKKGDVICPPETTQEEDTSTTQEQVTTQQEDLTTTGQCVADQLGDPCCDAFSTCGPEEDSFNVCSAPSDGSSGISRCLEFNTPDFYLCGLPGHECCNTPNNPQDGGCRPPQDSGSVDFLQCEEGFQDYCGVETRCVSAPTSSPTGNRVCMGFTDNNIQICGGSGQPCCSPQFDEPSLECDTGLECIFEPEPFGKLICSNNGNGNAKLQDEIQDDNELNGGELNNNMNMDNVNKNIMNGVIIAVIVVGVFGLIIASYCFYNNTKKNRNGHIAVNNVDDEEEEEIDVVEMSINDEGDTNTQSEIHCN